MEVTNRLTVEECEKMLVDESVHWIASKREMAQQLIDLMRENERLHVTVAEQALLILEMVNAALSEDRPSEYTGGGIIGLPSDWPTAEVKKKMSEGGYSDDPSKHTEKK